MMRGRTLLLSSLLVPWGGVVVVVALQSSLRGPFLLRHPHQQQQQQQLQKHRSLLHHPSCSRVVALRSTPAPLNSDDTSSTSGSTSGSTSSGGSSEAYAVLDEGSTKVKGLAGSLYKFVRPHTIRGTILAAVAGVAKALADVRATGGATSLFTADLFRRALCGLVALLLANAWIVGINQIYDKDVDKVNKPFLPIASGEITEAQAWVMLTCCFVAGLAVVSRTFSPLIFGLYALGVFIGTIYSVPPLELKKRGPLYAGLSIATCRGFLLNFGVYYAVLEALAVPFRWNPGVAFMARFMTVFAAVIAVTKDLPDVEGDTLFGVETFATKLGTTKVASVACLVLFLNYISAILQGALAPRGAFHTIPMVLGHTALAALLARNFRLFARRVDDAKEQTTNAVKALYKSIWDLFYLEYLLYAFI